ncbi:MAG TPA: EAL domain-containing protein [Burkholderiales bacterium]|nr:EAL domain-containing protein [Burkholderiales bacterium]
MSIPATIRVLLTEDVVSDAELEVRELKRAGLRVTHLITDTEQTFTAALRDFAPDVILSDFSMPTFDGMSALALARELRPETPFIFVSGTIGEEYAIRALKNGATDYVLKTNLVRLPAAVERALADARQRQRLARLSRIRDIASAVNSALVRLRERGALFDEFCRIAVSRGGFVLARIVELGRDGVARIAATTESDPALYQGVVDDYNRNPWGSDTLLAEVLRTGQPMVANDMANDSRVQNRAALTREGNYALAILPLRVADRIAGSVALRAREAGFFDQEELGLVSEMVSNISFALELMEKQEQVSYLALYDSLTGLPNRTLFHDRLTQAIQAQAARGDNSGLGLLLVDLERFKQINDAFGQATGDIVLKAMGERLRVTAGDINRVARLGSNIYAIMVPGINRAEDVARGIEQAAVLDQPFEIDGREVRVSAKTGIAVYPDDGRDADVLLRNAEAALKRAKETGERYLFYAPQINARVSEQVDLEHRLRKALEQGELFAHYQPKVDMASRAVIGLEALMRWHGPDGGLVSPVKFVPVLEQTGLIFEAGQQILTAASRMHRQWQKKGLNAPRIAVNVSALQLRRKSFVDDVMKALDGVGGDASGVDLEITESLLMSDVDESIRKLRELRDAGLRIALDDFGTGYSSLAYLSRLPLDALKIDRSFVHGMTEHADGTSIITAIISLAQALRLKVIAEGVETEPQAQLLRLLRCDQAQGYLFSPPVPAEKIETLL